MLNSPMQYCESCLLPDTRPNLTITDSGECTACVAHKSKPAIDWEARKKSFQSVVDNAKSKSTGYDCLIPVSGGKDSTWQTLKCLEYGLNPLCVTWKTPCRNEIGQQNLDNLISLGVDHIDFQIDPNVEKRFTRLAFEKYGATAVPMHMAIFSIPLKLAVAFNIPLIVWGENSAFEYGGEDDALKGFTLNRAWLNKYGVTHGTTAKDWVGDELSEKDMAPYMAPTDQEMEQAGISAVFLGYYFQWDPMEIYKTVAQHGFQKRAEGSKTGLYDFADIDDDFIITLHHYLKWYKFGFTRLWDNLSLEIRNGRLTRDQGIQKIKEIGLENPVDEITSFCNFTGMSRDEFNAILEKFRNHDIWYQEGNVWKIRNFLIEDWSWA